MKEFFQCYVTEILDREVLFYKEYIRHNPVQMTDPESLLFLGLCKISRMMFGILTRQ